MPREVDVANEAFFDSVLPPDETAPSPQSHNTSHNGQSFDVVGFCQRNGITIKSTKANGQGATYVLQHCIFDESHKAPDAALFVMASGAIAYKCLHASCAGYKWRDVRQKYEPGCYDPKPRQSNGSSGPTVDAEPLTYQRITAAELDAGKYDLAYLIDDMQVEGQPLITAAEKKALKTTIEIDAKISLASGLPFLGKFQAARKCRVALMSGESGLATIQETARRICRAKGIELADLGDTLIVSPDVPQLDDARHHAALEAFLRDNGIEALGIDPTYLCIPGDDAGNLIKQGRLLRIVGNICQELGVSLSMLHHCKKTVDDPFRPAELADIAWSGFAEWARQWWLLSRRRRYDPDRAGHHELWFNVGGSAGHSSLWALNIDEGSPKNPGGRKWQVEVLTASEARQQAAEHQQDGKEQARERTQAAKVKAARERIADALRGQPDNAGSKSKIQERSGMKGQAFDLAFASLLREGALEECEITSANKQVYPGFRYVFEKRS